MSGLPPQPPKRTKSMPSQGQRERSRSPSHTTDASQRGDPSLRTTARSTSLSKISDASQRGDPILRMRARSTSPSQRTGERSSSPITTTGTRLGPTKQSKRGGRRPEKGKSFRKLSQSFRKMASGRRRPPDERGPQSESSLPPPESQEGGAPNNQRVPPTRRMGPKGKSPDIEEGEDEYTDELPSGDRRSALQGKGNMRGYVRQSFSVVGKGVGTVARPIGRGARKVARPVGKGARKVGKAGKTVAKPIGKGARKVARPIGKAGKTVARPIGKGARKVTRPIAKSSVGRRVGRGMRLISQTDDCTNMKIMQYLVPIILIIGCSVGLVISSGDGSLTPGFKNFVPNISPEDVEDPFSGSEVPRWENKGGNGLKLTMVNALQDKWQVVFALAIADWDFGNPDALTLNIEQMDHDFDCDSIDGKVKVCNGNYGDTKWRGINQAVLKNGFIEASSAKMNEYYLSEDGVEVMQYTMCHEVGHSFGLPHSDENFNNEDLGNCMDYTTNFDANKHPDDMNYEYLTDLYGSAGGRRRRRQQQQQRGREKRQLSLRSSRITQGGGEGAPKHIKARIKEVVSKLEQRLDDNAHEDGWLLLHRNQHGEEHEMQVGEGYKVRVHMLLAK